MNEYFLIHVFVFKSGMKGAAHRALQRELQELKEHEEFPCKFTADLNNAVASNFLPFARSEGTWARKGAWLSKFFSFAKKVCRESGKVRTEEECLRSNVMCRHFVTFVASEDKGVTRPRSARTVLSAARIKRGMPSLKDDPVISAVVDGAEASNPRTRKQSAGVTATMVKLIARGWGASSSWFLLQIALIVTLGFVSLMRLGEIRTLHLDGVRVVFNDGSESLIKGLDVWPAVEDIKGLLFHLPWRKNHKHLDCWVPVACPVTIKLFLRHLRLRVKQKCRSRFLFPARRGEKMHHENPVGHQSVVSAMRHALCECVPLMTRKWAKLYAGHALRVGGSNHMRKIGIADDVHRRLGGWMTLVAAQGYMALSAREKLAYTVKLVGKQQRESAFRRDDALVALREHSMRELLA